MIKRIILSILFAYIPFSSYSQPPVTTAGKVGAGITKIVNRHPYMLTAPIIFPGFMVMTDGPLDPATALLATLVAWYCTGRLLKTVTKVIMDSCDIEPLQD